MNKYNITHKYDCLNNIEQILQQCNNDDIKNFIIDLRELIFYQMHEIRDQRMQIISSQHKNAWKQYDRPMDQYDYLTRSYIDKPDRTDTMGC